jgi:queuine tRNA-ribosyltransferase
LRGGPEARRSNLDSEIASATLGIPPRNDRAFYLKSKCSQTQARWGWVQTAHGNFHTPAFMPVGTQGSVKGLTPRDLKESGAEIILANAYHLSIRPGIEIIQEAGGLHKFMGWPGPILTDSGGYQVFSLSRLRKVTEEGVLFQSHFDGREIFITPERMIEIQEALGSDIMMIFDECPPYTKDRKRIKNSLDLTVKWAKRAREVKRREDLALFGIVQGGIFEDLRKESLEKMIELDFDGYALGGLFVGESKPETFQILDQICPKMPGNRPRYLMGAGTPLELLEAVGRGIDLFDCVNPTRYGRNGSAFTRKGLVVIRNGKYNRDHQPIEEDCGCYACRNFTRSYLRHLFNCNEMLGPQLVSLHNVHFFLLLMRRIREAIEKGSFAAFKKEFENEFDRSHRCRLRRNQRALSDNGNTYRAYSIFQKRLNNRFALEYCINVAHLEDLPRKNRRFFL